MESRGFLDLCPFHSCIFFPSADFENETELINGLDLIRQQFGEDTVKITKFNIVYNETLALQYTIEKIPTLVIFKGKESRKVSLRPGDCPQSRML